MTISELPVQPSWLPDFSTYQKLVDEGAELPLADPRFQRKLRSEERLHAHGVATLAWMSFIEGDDEARIRPQDEVANRALALMFIAVKAEMARDGSWATNGVYVNEFIDEYGAREWLTPREQQFLANPTADAQTNTQHVWGYESFWTLLWALGLLDELSWPTGICDVGYACDIVRSQTPQEFRAAAKLRPTPELLDEADHIYRLHWAVRQSRTNQTFSMPDVEPGVVMERHRTLNWLRTYSDQDWDLVSTDT